jgi:hypothetical protein
MRTFPKELGEFRRMVKARGDELRTMSRQQLIAAGQQLTDTWNVEGRPAAVSVIVEPMDDGSLRVVVQGFMQGKWFGQHVALDGFYHRPAGAIEPMTNEEFYEFD